MVLSLALAVALAVGPVHPDTVASARSVAARLQPTTSGTLALALTPPFSPRPDALDLAPELPDPRPLEPRPVLPTADAPQVVEYSDGYFTRLKIHKWASYLTVPLFVGQYIAGEKLIDGQGGTWRDVHGALAGGVAGLFAVNTVTGAMNFWEARKDPAEKGRRTLHSALMLLADIGFVATGALANESEGGRTADNGTHKSVALASMGVALVSYAIMLPPFRNE